MKGCQNDDSKKEEFGAGRGEADKNWEHCIARNVLYSIAGVVWRFSGSRDGRMGSLDRSIHGEGSFRRAKVWGLFFSAVLMPCREMVAGV